MPYLAADPHGKPTDRTCIAPFVFCARAALWQPIFGGAIDEMTSDPRTLDVLSQLIRFTEPKVLVEVGTYRGWGTTTFAETLRLYDMPGHVWSCDPVDLGVSQLLAQAELTDRVTWIHGTFEDLLARLETKMDFCYIDASEAQEASLRLRYTKLALQHMNPRGMIAVDDAGGDWRGAKALRRMGLYLPHLRGLVLIAT